MPGICGGIVRASMLKRRKKSPVVLQSYQNSDPEDEEGEEEMLDQEEEIDLDQLAELSEQDMSSSDEDEEGDGMEENDEDDGIDEEKDEESSKQTDKPTRREVIRKRKAEREATEMRTVFIGNAPATMKRRAIKQMFRPFGHVEAVYQRTLLQMTEKLTKLMEGKDLQLHDRLTSSNFYVRFAQEEEAQKAAQQMNGTKLGGNTLRVSLSTKRKCEHTLSVFVGNLPFSSTDDEVRAHFSECGPVVAVRLLRDRETGLGRGAGYVQFERKESIAKALHLDGEKMGERPLRISKLVKKKKRPGAGVGGVQKGGSAPRKVADNWRRGTNRRQQLPKGVEKMVVLKRGARQIQRFKQPRHSEAPQKRQLSKKVRKQIAKRRSAKPGAKKGRKSLIT